MKTKRNESARGVSPYFVGQHRPGKVVPMHSPSPQPSPQGEGEPFPVLISSLPLHTSARAARPPLLEERVGVRGNLTVKCLAQLGRNLVAQVSRLAGTRSIPASYAQAQRLGVRVLLQLAGWEACATPLRLAPVRALPPPSRRATPALILRKTRR